MKALETAIVFVVVTFTLIVLVIVLTGSMPLWFKIAGTITILLCGASVSWNELLTNCCDREDFDYDASREEE